MGYNINENKKGTKHLFIFKNTYERNSLSFDKKENNQENVCEKNKLYKYRK